MRDAIQTGKVDTLQGPITSSTPTAISASRVVSGVAFQVQQDKTHPASDVLHQFKYIGVALADNS